MRSYRYRHGVRLRVALFAASVLWVAPAAAQDATWNGATAQWTTAANWLPATVPTGVATFAGAGSTNVTVSSNAAIGQIDFTSATLYALKIKAGALFQVTGAGITGSGTPPAVTVLGALQFGNSATAGAADITNRDGGATAFLNNAAAASASIKNREFSATGFLDFSTAGTAIIVNNGGTTYFLDQSTAANAGISNRNFGATVFGVSGGTDTASAGSATITNHPTGGETVFFALTTAGAATIINNGGATGFFDNSNAGTAHITNKNGGLTLFADNASAASATIDNRDGCFCGPSLTLFTAASTAGNAAITNSNFGAVFFSDNSTASNATIVNNADGATVFGTAFSTDAPTAGNATITNNAGGVTVFQAFSTAANAIITTNAGGAVGFFDNATGGNAQFITNAGGVVDFSQTLGPAGDGRITAGSIAGAGDYYLGSNQLTVGGNNLSTEVSGTINDGVSPFFACGCTPASSSASLVKVGSGTLTLSGVNSYTGPTVVDAGMLVIAPTGSITSNVTNNAFFLNAGLVTGNLVSNGTTTNTGTITGAAAVNSGLLGNDGTIAGVVTVNAGGALVGNGTVGGLIINGGTLSPGHSIGTITVTGNLAFVGAGNYIVEVSPAAADKVNVAGTAAIAGTLQAFAVGAGYKIGTTYTVINTAGGVSGTFATLAITGSFGAAKPHVEYDAHNVYLVLGPNAISPSLAGGTPNQKAVAGGVDAALQAGNQLPQFDALFNLAPGQLPAAFDALSGEVHASTAGILVDESLYVRSAVLGRLRQASYGGDAGMAALGAGGPQLAFSDDALTPLLAYASLPVKAPLAAPAPSRDVAFWGQGFGAWSRFDGDGNAAALRRDLAGFFTGVDGRFGDWRGGIATGYTASRYNLDGRGAATVETGHLAAYGGWSAGAFRLRGGAAYAWHTIDTDRTIAFPGFFDRASGHYNGGTGQVFGEAGYGFSFGKVAVEQFAGAAFVHLAVDPFSERGGAAALRGAANALEAGYSTLGIRAASMIPLMNDMMLVPRVSVAWQHALNDVTPTDALAFQTAAAPFVIAGVPIARDSLLSEAGLDLAMGRHATLGLSYVGQLARNVQDHAAKGKFTWKF